MLDFQFKNNSTPLFNHCATEFGEESLCILTSNSVVQGSSKCIQNIRDKIRYKFHSIELGISKTFSFNLLYLFSPAKLPENVKVLTDIMRLSQGCILLLVLKQHLKEMYGLTEG